MSVRNVHFRKTNAGVVVEGMARPGETVTTENLSAAPFAPSSFRDTFSSTTAGNDGRFRVEVPLAMTGDKVALQLGEQKSIFAIQLDQAQSVDGRRAEVGHQGLRLAPDATGGYRFLQVRRSARLGEPGAELAFVNQRTGTRASFVLGPTGELPASARLTGQPGDSFTLHVTDGAHRQYFDDGSWGTLTIPVPPDENGVQRPVATPGETVLLSGPLFDGAPDFRDPEQGRLGDCYLVATLSGLAAAQPERLRECIRDNADGTVTVSFRRYDAAQARYVPHDVTIDRMVPAERGSLRFGRDDDRSLPDRAESWFPLLEKAYAAWKGSYDAVECGYPYEVFEALLGTEGEHVDTRGIAADRLYRRLDKAMAENAVVLAWTGGETTSRRFTNSGLYGDHAYTVLNVYEEAGVQRVMLRNPWGRGEPGGHGADDGVFSMPMEAFMNFFVGVGVAT